MYVCMYVCMYVRMYVCMYVCMYVKKYYIHIYQKKYLAYTYIIQKTVGDWGHLELFLFRKETEKNAFSQKMSQSALVQLSDHLICADCALRLAIND